MRARLNAVGLTSARLAVIAAGFITVYFGYAVIGNRFHQYQLDREQTQLESRIRSEQDRFVRLDALRQWMQSDQFIEASARKEGMIRPGDHAIVVAAPTATPTTGATGEWWQKYIEP